MDKIEQIVKTSCFVSNLDINEFNSRSRERHIIDTRRMVYSICKDILNMPWTHIGKYFKVNHATIIHHYNNHLNILRYDRNYEDIYMTILELVKADLGYVDAKILLEEIRKFKSDKIKEKLELKNQLRVYYETEQTNTEGASH